MISRLWHKFKNKPTIEFRAVFGDWSISTPIVTAKEFKAKWQKEQNKDNTIASCPGIHDYMQSGYILSLPLDYKIKANSAGTGILVTSNPVIPAPDILQPKPPERLNPNLISGFMNSKVDGVKLEICKITLPWSVVTKKGYSCLFLPCVYHADYLENIHVYAGIVDTDKYHSISLIFSVKKPGEYELPAGTPVIQIIPFKREEYFATCQKASEEEFDYYKYTMITRVRNFYRKYLHSQKKFYMNRPQGHEHIFLKKE